MYDCPEMALEPRDPSVVGRCEVCGKEVYDGSMVWIDEGHMIHNDESCLKEWIESRYNISDICYFFGMSPMIVGEED